MKSVKSNCRVLNRAERGRVIQHVIVDRWSTSDAARAFGVEERAVAAWVQKYRRRGMASLRDDTNRPRLGRRLIGELSRWWRRFGRMTRRGGAPPGALSPLRRGQEDRR